MLHFKFYTFLIKMALVKTEKDINRNISYNSGSVLRNLRHITSFLIWRLHFLWMIPLRGMAERISLPFSRMFISQTLESIKTLPCVAKRTLLVVEVMDFEIERLFRMIWICPKIRVHKNRKSFPARLNGREMWLWNKGYEHPTLLALKMGDEVINQGIEMTSRS